MYARSSFYIDIDFQITRYLGFTMLFPAFGDMIYISIVRFASVAKQFPKEADELFAAAQENAQWRYKSYLRMLGTQW